ncbi:MAG: sodium:proton antiporter [Lachnospiraceae bacterium]|nr:sodium:proton antiporter [Lachnospiraceae bacterium]
MSSGIHALETTYYFLFIGILMVLGIMLFLCLLRACIGPTVADRLVSINMMGTMVMVIIATLAIMMEESYLVDICIIYAMISFLAVIVLSKVIMGVKKEKESKEEHKDRESDEELLMKEAFDESFIEEDFDKEPEEEREDR